MTSDELIVVLTRFHREVVMPDVERIVDSRLGERIGSLRDEMLTQFDGVSKRLDRLESEHYALSAAVRRLETEHYALTAAVGRIEARFA
jgi:hypothetical protein